MHFRLQTSNRILFDNYLKRQFSVDESDGWTVNDLVRLMRHKGFRNLNHCH